MLHFHSLRWLFVPVLTLTLGWATPSLTSLGYGQQATAPADAADIDSLINKLNSDDSATRRSAASALGDAGDDSPKVIEALMKAVGDDEPRNRLIAVAALRKLVSDPADLVPMASELLAHEDQLLASRATETLVLRGAKAVPFLTAALKNERAAYWACIAIEEIGPDAAPTVPGLQSLLRESNDDHLKVQALLAIAKIGPAGKQAAPEIAAALADANTEPVKIAAAFAAGTHGVTDAKATLITNTKSSNKMVSMVSIWALAKLYPENEKGRVLAVETLIKGLTDSDPALRLMAAKGLQLLAPDPEIVAPRLVKVLKQDDPIVAFNLVEAFASLGEPAAARAADALQSESLRSLAAQVLSRMGPEAASVASQVTAALKDSSGEFRQQLQSTLANIGPAAAPATPELIRSLSDDAADIRISATLALANIGPAANAAKAGLLNQVQSSNSDFESVAAAYALVKIAANDADTVGVAIPVLVAGLKLDDPTVQAEAASALGELGKSAAAAAEALNQLSADPATAPYVREAAAEALAKIKGEAASR
ncbi:HEAT repeat domain-containing protein [Roseimaritima ulvae]|uniref:HEAT repeat protein n=1 Tax=Roseimaritima ulvae TaxID=980254 RepID=A0A5B9QP45_9BACT|nr:HEAT repeat domain-containing protein [Roseimaritima ulvae]QEG39430.1 HEAT repeat protein [Roseimaritima ulvae]